MASPPARLPMVDLDQECGGGRREKAVVTTGRMGFLVDRLPHGLRRAFDQQAADPRRSLTLEGLQELAPREIVIGHAVLVHRFSCPSPSGVTCFFGVTYGSLQDVCSQYLSEADLSENHGCPNLFLPNHWSRHVKSALLHVISLARLVCIHTWG